MDFQLGQQPGGRGRVAFAPLVGAGGGVHRNGAVDLRQLAGELRVLLMGGQLGAHAGLDGAVVDVLVHARQTAEFLDQGQGGLFAHARHAGDVVRGVAHQALHLDELLGAHAVFFLHSGLVHHHGLAAAHPGGGQQHGHVVVHQLQAVPVTGGQVALVAPGGSSRAQGAQNVVRLVALLGDHHEAQVGQQLFQHRHLLGQLLGHALAGGLVAVVHLVAEGGGLQVKGDGHLVRLDLF